MRLKTSIVSSLLETACFYINMKDIEIYHKEIESILKENKKPTLFLHACCGPCLAYPLVELAKYFDITIGFFNPNIFPESEYTKRYETLKEYVSSFNKKNNLNIKVILNNDDFIKYQELFKERKDDFEGGNTCLKCHAYRMNLAYEYAYKNHFDYFTTVMSVSSKKPSHELNVIGMNLEKKYPTTKFLIADFKKENGQLLGIRISKEENMYRQNYCGCKYSLLERDKRKISDTF